MLNLVSNLVIFYLGEDLLGLSKPSFLRILRLSNQRLRAHFLPTLILKTSALTRCGLSFKQGGMSVQIEKVLSLRRGHYVTLKQNARHATINLSALCTIR